MNRIRIAASVAATLLALGPRAAVVGAASPDAAPKALGRWLFDERKGETAGDGLDGATSGRIVKATWGEGRSASGALVFEDYSLLNYLKPDVREATRVVVPHNERLNPTGPFTLRAVVYPTRDPLYYGGIVEKGRGYGASYRLMVIRGLKVRGAIGAAHVAVTSAEPISMNAWHEIELAWDGSSLTLRIDGVERGRARGEKAALTSKDDVVFGERLSGRIDEVTLTAP